MVFVVAKLGAFADTRTTEVALVPPFPRRTILTSRSLTSLGMVN